MSSTGNFKAKTHRIQQPIQVDQAETTSITNHTNPIAVLSPARPRTSHDVTCVIAKFRAYCKLQAISRVPVSIAEIKEMTEEGRP